jgi:hypothetical protein
MGDVFTPLQWGEFAVSQFDIFNAWINGATVFDPTMGHGHLLESLVSFGTKQGYSIHDLPINHLFGNEINTYHHATALDRFKEKYGLDMSENFSNKDLLCLTPKKFDIILGNPPWQNFVDLPPRYKEKIKPLFATFDLVVNKQNLLLGGARIDIAALIIQVSILNFLKNKGKAYFFMPLSLLLNDGAHEQFRTYKIHKTHFSPVKIFDFNKEPVFNNVSTRYGLVHFKKNEEVSFPIDYFIFNDRNWQQFLASPIGAKSGPLSIFKKQSEIPNKFHSIEISRKSTPRQGLNTCGANNIYIFKTYKKISQNTCIVNNNIELPDDLIFPLLTSENFKNPTAGAKAWVLLPYKHDGRPLAQEAIKGMPQLKKYLNSVRGNLISRKGVLINSWIKRGFWWALMGVGPYNFAPYKIVWEAYGKKKFIPRLFPGEWQANQALQAFIPFDSKQEAEQALEKLQDPAIEEYLLSLKMEGTMNWAQPGKIKKLIHFV